MTSMWLATIAGAALFFAAGFLARMVARENEARVGASMPIAAVTSPTLALDADRDDLAGERDRAISARDQLLAERDELVAKTRRAGAERQQLATERDTLAAERKKLMAERDRLAAERKKLITERDQLVAERKKLVTERDALITERDGLAADKQRVRTETDEKSAAQTALKAEVASLHKDRESLAAQLETANAAHASLVAEAERMRGQLANHPELVAEADDLRARVADRDRLGAEVKRLEAEVAQLRALELCSAEPPTIADGTRLPRTSSTTATALESILQRVAANADTRAAVIADELGLPVVAFGEHASSLAALGSVVGDTGQRARTLLPMGAIRGFSMADENSATITSWPVTAADASLMILTLTVGPGPADDIMRTAALEAASAVK